MTEKIYIDARPGEIRVATLDEGKLTDLTIEREGQVSIQGNIYLGRVEKVNHRLKAAFVDFGQERSGFLALPEVRPYDEKGNIGDFLAEGDAVLVQVLSEPVENKGAKLTAKPTLPGRYLVLTAEDERVHISKRIESEEERDRLEDIAFQVLEDGDEPLDCGFVIRTAAEGVPDNVLSEEAHRLAKNWGEIEKKAETEKVPSLVWQDYHGLARRMLAMPSSSDIEIIADRGEAAKAVLDACKEVAPDLEKSVTEYKEGTALFEAEGIAEQIDEALSAKVMLPSGASIIIEQTAACVAIDVNSGAEGPVTANLEAAAEIARQLRVRNLSGLIIIDFVSMRRRQDMSKIVDELKKACQHDPVGAQIVGSTNLGLVEMTRRRQGKTLSAIMETDCARCGGTGLVPAPEEDAITLLNSILRETAANPGQSLKINARESVIEWYQGAGKPAFDLAVGQLGYTPELVAKHCGTAGVEPAE